MHEIIANFGGRRVLVVGDCCHDIWTYGTVNRTSPEAPIQVLDDDSVCDASEGMAGLVASMVNALGGEATLVATYRSNWQTKTRIMGRVPGRGYQPLLRVDSKAPGTISDSEADGLLDRSRQALLDGCTAVLLCDYAKGTCTPYLCRELRKLAGQFRVPIAVDPGRNADWSNYRGMIVKANESELANSGWATVNAIKQLELPALIVTLGQIGMDVRVDDPSCDVGCAGTRVGGQSVDGVDVCGAGDQVMAVLGLGLAAYGRELDRDFCRPKDELGCEGPLLDLCRVANIAGRMQVQRHGCVPVTAEELQDELAKHLTSTVAA